MWRYWDWEAISKKYVKHISRIIFLFLSIFLMVSIHKKESFDILNIYNFTNKRPELIDAYKVITVDALPYLQDALSLCLYIVPILILITWIPDSKNIKFFSMLYGFSLILFGFILTAYMLGLVLLFKATSWWFIFFIVIILLIVGTFIISHICSKMLKKEQKKSSKINKILIGIVVLLSMCLEVFLAYPKIVDSKNALIHHYMVYSSYNKYLLYDSFSMTHLSYSENFKDIRDELQKGSKAYIIFNYINLYSSEEYSFTADEIIAGVNALEEYSLDTSAPSWNITNDLYDAHKSAIENSKHISKYNMKNSPLSSGNVAMHAFYENVIRRLYEQEYIEDVNSLKTDYIDKSLIDEACQYVYDTFESGLFEPVPTVTINVSYENGEYVFTINDSEPYFIHTYHTLEDENEIRIHLYHSVGYYFDENTMINVEDVDSYNISDIELEFQTNNKDRYADITFTVNIK